MLPHKVFETSGLQAPLESSLSPEASPLLPVWDRFSGLTQGPAELVTFTYSCRVRSQGGDRVSLPSTTLSHLSEDMDTQAELNPEAHQALH